MSLVLDGTSGMTAPQGAVYNGIASGTAVASTSGTSIDFTSIPSWVKRITVMLNGVSLSGTSNYLIQIGSGSLTTSGYLGSAGALNNAAASTGVNFTNGFGIIGALAANVVFGSIVITNISSNIWIASGAYGYTGFAGSGSSGGNITLSGTLDRIRITTVNGTDTFDAGSINILYE